MGLTGTPSGINDLEWLAAASYLEIDLGPPATPTYTFTPINTYTPTPFPTFTGTVTITPTPTPTATPTVTPTVTPTATVEYMVVGAPGEKLVLPDPNDPANSLYLWAQEITRRLRTYNFYLPEKSE